MRRFFIVNEIDHASERLIAERRGEKYYYIHPDFKNKFVDGMTPENPTTLEDFGIQVEISGGKLYGKSVLPSVARYPDGALRRWQGSEKFSVQI